MSYTSYYNNNNYHYPITKFNWYNNYTPVVEYKDAHYEMDKYISDKLTKYDKTIKEEFLDGQWSYNELGFDPLTYHVINNNSKMVEKLLEDGANPNGSKTVDSLFGFQVPLYYTKDIRVTNLLLRYDADPNYYPHDFYKAHEFDYARAVRGMEPYGSPFYHHLVTNNNNLIIPLLKLYLDNGKNPNSNHEFSMLFERFHQPLNDGIFNLLVEYGANLDDVEERIDYLRTVRKRCFHNYKLIRNNLDI